jgi:hypothetical protein
MTVLQLAAMIAAFGIGLSCAQVTYRVLIGRRGPCWRVVVALTGLTYGLGGDPGLLPRITVGGLGILALVTLLRDAAKRARQVRSRLPHRHVEEAATAVTASRQQKADAAGNARSRQVCSRARSRQPA